MNRYGSRKFIIALLVLIGATALRYLDLLDGGQWVTSSGGVMALYAFANVAQKFAPLSVPSLDPRSDS